MNLLVLAQEPPDAGYGPVRATSMSPLPSLRAGFVPLAPSPLPEGQFELRVAATWINMWAFNEHDVLLDYEQLHADASVAYGLGDGARLELEVQSNSRFGGVMDPVIDRFHERTGAQQRHRDEFPQNDFRFELRGREGRPSVALADRDRGEFERSVLTTLQQTFWNEGCALSWSVTLRAPFGPSDLSGGLPFDAGASLGATMPWGDVRGYLAVGAMWFGREEFRGIELRPVQAGALAALEWRVGTETSLIFQFLLTEGAAEDWFDFSRPSSELMLALKWKAAGGVVLEIGVIENLVIPDNSPDFGVHAGIVIRPDLPPSPSDR